MTPLELGPTEYKHFADQTVQLESLGFIRRCSFHRCVVLMPEGSHVFSIRAEESLFDGCRFVQFDPRNN